MNSDILQDEWKKNRKKTVTEAEKRRRDMRCQLCDGPVVGGRCKNCGMPYKNDEILYHVNENRRTHDRHTSEKAGEEPGKKTDVSEPVKKAQQSQPQNRTVRSNTGNQPVDRTKKQKKTAKVTTASVSEKKNTLYSEPKKKKKHQGIFLVLSFLIVFLPVIQGLWDTWRSNMIRNDIMERYVYEPDTDEESLPVKTELAGESTREVSDDPFLILSTNDESGFMEYALSAGHGQAFAGKEIELGIYRVYTNKEEVKLVQEGVGGKEIYLLKTGKEVEITLKEGDLLYLDEYEDSYDSVYLRKTV